jgi:hypothetical protein
MWVYAGMNALAFLFIWRFLPELSGRSLEMIEEALCERRFTPAAFARSRPEVGGAPPTLAQVRGGKAPAG